MGFISKTKQVQGSSTSNNLRFFCIVSLLIIVFHYNVASTYAAGYVFSKTISMGSSSEDVRQLQILLNADSDTQIAQQGAGSPGQETNRFGSLTKAAVIRFQKKYAQDILVPAGLAKGTGVVGALTRAKLNALSANGLTAQSNSQNTASNNAGSVSFHSADTSTSNSTAQNQIASVAGNLLSALRLYQVAPFQVKPGGTVTIIGDNLSSDAVFHIGDSNTASLLANSPTETRNFTSIIPNSVPTGTYTVWVTNAKGSSQRATTPIKLVVTNNPQPAPTLSVGDPSTISSLSTPISISGTGFNGIVTIVSKFGTLIVTPTSSQSLTFKPSNFSNAASLQKIVNAKPAGKGVKVGFYLTTDSGVTSTGGAFIVQ